MTYEWEATRSYSIRGKKSFFLGISRLGCYNSQPTDMASSGSSSDYSKLLKKDGEAKLD